MSATEIVVTGIGIVSPAGFNADETWKALVAGETAIRPLAGVNLPEELAQFGGQVPLQGVATQPGRANLFASMAAKEALRQASWDKALPALCLGISKPDLGLVGRLFSVDQPRGWPLGFPAVPEGIHLESGALFHGTVAACSTGTLAVIRGIQILEKHRADAVLCVCADASIEPLWMAAYQRLGVLARAHPQRGPGYACRPFDRTRCGFAVGEGAGAVLLESLASARARKAAVLARVAGHACGSDPSGLTRLDPAGTPLGRVITDCLVRARCEPADVCLTMAHGTATSANDAAELAALRSALRSRLPQTPVVSIKGPLGHLLGAAGAVELAIAIKARAERMSPGNNTLIEPDPDLGECCLPTQAFDLRDGAILKTSLGFGGHLAAIILG